MKERKKIDWSKIDWKRFYGIVRSVDGMKGNQDRMQRTKVIEWALETFSAGQLKYVGDTVDGMDFMGIDGNRYECKSASRIFPKTKRTAHTSQQVLKNHRSSKKELEQTFDYMIMVDTFVHNSVGVCKWDDLITVNEDAVITFKAKMEDITMVAENVQPDPDLAAHDLGQEIWEIIKSHIRSKNPAATKNLVGTTAGMI